jgi:hypothetical protein
VPEAFKEAKMSRAMARASRLLRGFGLLATAVAAIGWAVPAGAQSADPPSEVGRVAAILGTVSFHAAGAPQDWTPAELNYPLVAGDAIWAEPGAHAAIDVGPAAFRLDGATEFDAEAIDDATARFRIDQGSVNVRLAALDPGTVDVVDTPRGAVTFQAPGLYRIDAGAADRPTRIVVFAGLAAFAGPGGSSSVAAGQAIDVTGANPVTLTPSVADQTALDQWAAAQDAGQVTPVGQYVSIEETGYQDLGRYGAWENTPDGWVWYPSGVSADWAPYRFGHWAWIEPWGWTWIDDAPWGFVPFHYGRWAEYRGRWAWVPGGVERHPVYAPALVAWIGGDGWSLSISAGAIAAIGWVPLGPHEAYRPAYHASAGYQSRLNGGYRAVARSDFVNRNAATIVSHQDFAASRPVARAALHPSSQQLASAPFVAQPGAASLPRPATQRAASAPRPHPASLPRPAAAANAPQRQAQSVPAVRPASEPAHPAPKVARAPAPKVARAPARQPAFDPGTPPPLVTQRYTPHPAWEPASPAPRPTAPRPAPRPSPAPRPAPAAHAEPHPEPHPESRPAQNPPAPEHPEPPHH